MTQLLMLPTTNPQQYHVENMGGHELVSCYYEQHNCICLTDQMLPMVDRIPSTTPGVEPPRDAKDSG